MISIPRARASVLEFECVSELARARAIWPGESERIPWPPRPRPTHTSSRVAERPASLQTPLPTPPSDGGGGGGGRSRRAGGRTAEKSFMH